MENELVLFLFLSAIFLVLVDIANSLRRIRPPTVNERTKEMLTRIFRQGS